MFVAASPMPVSYTSFFPQQAMPYGGQPNTPTLAPFDPMQQQRFLMMQQLELMETMLDMMTTMMGGAQMPQAMGMGSRPGLSSPATQRSYQGDPTQLMAPAAGTNYSGPLNVQGAIQAVPGGHRSAASTSFPLICSECQRQGVTDKQQVAYILATTVHESGAGKNMTEFASGQAYEGRSSLGNTQSGDGPRFKGRGFVQVTGRRNYQQWSRKLGVDLVGNPELARRPDLAARILVQGMREGTFTGRRLGDYVGGGKQDFENARRVVNGRDKAGPIAAMARNIAAAL